MNHAEAITNVTMNRFFFILIPPAVVTESVRNQLDNVSVFGLAKFGALNVVSWCFLAGPFFLGNIFPLPAGTGRPQALLLD